MHKRIQFIRKEDKEPDESGRGGRGGGDDVYNNVNDDEVSSLVEINFSILHHYQLLFSY